MAQSQQNYEESLKEIISRLLEMDIKEHLETVNQIKKYTEERIIKLEEVAKISRQTLVEILK